MTLQTFASDHRLKIRSDECGDPIIRGTRGHIYVDNGKVCAMWVDAPVMQRARLEQLGGSLWVGDISPNSKGKRVQDVKVDGVEKGSYRLLIQLTKARTKKVLSEEQLAAMKLRLVGVRKLAKAAKKGLPTR